MGYDGVSTMKPPILITGATRSGTTWVTKMLCAGKSAVYIAEPSNPVRKPGWIPKHKRTKTWSHYVCEEDTISDEHKKIFKNIIEFRYPISSAIREFRTLRQLARIEYDLYLSVNGRIFNKRAVISRFRKTRFQPTEDGK